MAMVYAAINSSPYFVANALQKYSVTFNDAVLITKLPNICKNDFILGLKGNLILSVMLVFLYNNMTAITAIVICAIKLAYAAPLIYIGLINPSIPYTNIMSNTIFNDVPMIAITIG